MSKRYLDANDIKEAIPPTTFYCDRLSNRHSSSGYGWQIAGLCPFHADNNAGSFYVYLTSGAFQCFACGAKGGDIIAFTRQLHDMTFVDAINTTDTERVLTKLNQTEESFLLTKQVAKILCRSPKTLANWRASGKGPPWLYVEGRPMYPLSQLKEDLKNKAKMASTRSRVKRKSPKSLQES